MDDRDYKAMNDKSNEHRTCQTPLEDLRQSALTHYEEASTKYTAGKMESQELSISIGTINK
jgi:hypothetical protein